MPRVTVLIPSPAPPLILESCAEHFDVLHLWQYADPDSVIGEQGARVQGIAAAGCSVGSDLMDRLPNLRIIANLGVGCDNVDVAAACERDIVVTNTPGVLDAEVADTAIGLLLMVVRELGRAEQYLRAGRWSTGPYALSPTTLSGRTMGIVGLGRIGTAIARRAGAFGMSVSYHSRRPADVPYRYHSSLLDLARHVDTLMIATPGGPLTRHLVNATVLRALGPDGVIVNVSRGSVLDERALVSALRAKIVLGAGLDVYEAEPQVSAELLELPNAVLLPHVGTASVPTRRAMAQLVVDNLTGFFHHGRSLTPVSG
ncbi:2-hydroxyacid dehydrogenase [Amycolatopsis magusensis]|uniref:2-hydroxyacid dehydrogenase n=1 Tax=Amycolatopsis magusensis TaxID=882444 RepID=UPI0024A9EE69|nr:2-hydroxyacid dehydrogenase [Amycolatopsis magusensis]MDI5977892.1 2-hydroxyacid dehydrogenase [Amycolatopsis magusensis]